MRSDPSTSADVVTTVAAGQLLGLGPGSREGFGPVEADGHAWYPAALLPDAQLPPLLIGPLGFTARGWVAGDFLELVEPRCVAGDPDLRILSTQTPWERYACIGNRSITFDGTFGCGGCGGARSGTFEPAWLAFPMDLGFISVDPNERIGPMTLRFPDGGAEVPDSGSVLRVTGHYGDPAAEQCVYQPVDEPIPASTDAVQLYCEIQFVVESYEITGIDTDFPSG